MKWNHVLKKKIDIPTGRVSKWRKTKNFYFSVQWYYNSTTRQYNSTTTDNKLKWSISNSGGRIPLPGGRILLPGGRIILPFWVFLNFVILAGGLSDLFFWNMNIFFFLLFFEKKKSQKFQHLVKSGGRISLPHGRILPPHKGGILFYAALCNKTDIDFGTL